MTSFKDWMVFLQQKKLFKITALPIALAFVVSIVSLCPDDTFIFMLFAADDFNFILMIFDDNSKIFFVIFHKNLCCGCSLESPRGGDFNEHPQHRFLRRF